MMPKVALVLGDGVGPEVMAEASKLIGAVNKAYSLQFETVEFDLSADHFLQTGIALPDGVIETIRKEMGAILLGPLGDPRVRDDQHGRSVLKGFIRELDLFVGVRRVRPLLSDLCPLAGMTEQDVDLTIIWEAKGGVYTDVGGSLEKGSQEEVVIDQEVITRSRVERVIRYAFEHALKHGRTGVTVARKSKDYSHSYDIWHRTFQEVREDFPDISASERRFETVIQQVLETPEQFDVLVTNHFFGSILSALGTALQGGLGLVASANLAPGKMGLFRPLHPSSTRYAGKDYANPMAAMISVQELMEFMGQRKISHAIRSAIRKALRSGWVTRDLNGSMGTSEVGDYVCSALMDSAP